MEKGKDEGKGERERERDHLNAEDAKGPDVSGVLVALAQHNLRTGWEKMRTCKIN